MAEMRNERAGPFRDLPDSLARLSNDLRVVEEEANRIASPKLSLEIAKRRQDRIGSGLAEPADRCIAHRLA